MEAVIVRACGFLFIIAFGFFTKRVGIFRAADKEVITKLIMKVTLPMALAGNFRSLEWSMTYALAFAIGAMANILVVVAVLMIFRNKAAEEKTFLIINGAGYNIGLCTIPFLQSFFDGDALAMVCLFDAGNAVMAFGVILAVATMISQNQKKFSMKAGGKILLHSVPFMTYMIMISLTLLHITLPDALFDTMDLISAANPFLAMFLIGILFEPKVPRNIIKDMGRVVIIRFVAATIFIFIVFQMPVSLVFKHVISLALVSPILSIAPIFTKQCGGNDSAAAVLNSLMLPVCMVVMTILLGIFQVA
ncbi:AEC family transporter [Chakrabartyella piscis]|uniref:AEC family transporter n=1 Tax=Chakrabartyella piscis TaxID=2918914 RepID=UPI0029589483|nr:AEC family transporter [Chakrabartyella piscis]